MDVVVAPEIVEAKSDDDDDDGFDVRALQPSLRGPWLRSPVLSSSTSPLSALEFLRLSSLPGA